MTRQVWPGGRRPELPLFRRSYKIARQKQAESRNDRNTWPSPPLHHHTLLRCPVFPSRKDILHSPEVYLPASPVEAQLLSIPDGIFEGAERPVRRTGGPS